MRGFDFTGARLHYCNFNKALIKGARFDIAEINGSNLEAASDYADYVTQWEPAPTKPNDVSLPEGAVFRDAPFAPKLTVFWQFAELPGDKAVNVIAISPEITQEDWKAAAGHLMSRNRDVPKFVTASAYADMLSSATGAPFTALDASWTFTRTLPPSEPVSNGLGFRVARLYRPSGAP